MDETIDKITKFVFIPSTIKPVDIIIVLGNDYIKTMDSVADIYHKGYCKKILITGHSSKKDQTPESERFLKRAIQLGISEDDIILESEASNTKENFIYSKKLLSKDMKSGAIKDVMIVCLAFHSRRSLMTAKKWFSNSVNYIFFTTSDNRHIKANTWYKTNIGRKRVFEEIERIGKYSVKGDLEI